MHNKTEEKLSCRLCYIQEIQNRKYILSDCAIYIGIVPITLGSKEWTEITITTTENEIWELVNIIKGSMKLSFLHKQIKNRRKTNKDETPKTDI